MIRKRKKDHGKSKKSEVTKKLVIKERKESKNH